MFRGLMGGRSVFCFVLELPDPIALVALAAYASEAKLRGYDKLADELDEVIAEHLRS